MALGPGSGQAGRIDRLRPGVVLLRSNSQPGWDYNKVRLHW